MTQGHSLRGSVDWNAHIDLLSLTAPSHSLRGSVDWNTIIVANSQNMICHSLRGSVDWNIVYKALNKCIITSLPAWECGLKCLNKKNYVKKNHVTPCVGVWIEILKFDTSSLEKLGHSLRGSVDWNCQWKYILSSHLRSHSLRGSVDWNLCVWLFCIVNHESLPAWECGLKYFQNQLLFIISLSLPAWECGLKFVRTSIL